MKQGGFLAHGARTVWRRDTVVIASAAGTEPHSNLDGSVSTQVLLKSRFYSATCQVSPGSLWWHRRAAPS